MSILALSTYRMCAFTSIHVLSVSGFGDSADPKLSSEGLFSFVLTPDQRLWPPQDPLHANYGQVVCHAAAPSLVY